MKRLITVLALGPVLLLAACGDAEKDSSPEPAGAAASTPTATATETPTPTPTEEPAGGSAEKVAIKGFAFGPGTVKVKTGDTITWTNDDAAPHTVTAKSGGEVDSGTLAKGATFEFTPEQAGTIEYFCAIHPSMVGTIEAS